MGSKREGKRLPPLYVISGYGPEWGTYFKGGMGGREERGDEKKGKEIPASKVKKGQGSPYSITESERRVPELIPVLCSQPAGDVSYKPGGRLPLLSARPAVTLATLKRTAINFAAW